MTRPLTVAEAAKVLGISKDGVRKRIQRKQLAVTWLDGVRMVVLEDKDLSQDNPVTETATPTGELVNALREQIRQLTEQNAQLWEQFGRVSATLDRQAAILDRVLSLPANAGPSADVRDHTAPRRQADDADQPPLSFWQRIFGRGREA